jgi:hypothetical protein
MERVKCKKKKKREREKDELGHKIILCKGKVVNSFKVSFQDLAGGTEENRQEFQTEEPASGPRIKPLAS